MMWKSAFVAVGLGISCCSWGWQTCLNVIPTADMVGHRQVLLGYSLCGSEEGVDPVYYHIDGIEIGLWDRIEFGYDYDFEGADAWNLKLKFYEEGNFALAAGILNVQKGTATGFAAAKYAGSGYNLHLGWLRDGTSRLYGGVDFPLFTVWTGMLDHIGGPHGSTWFGVCGEVLTPGLCLTANFGIPDCRSDGIQHSLTLEYTFSF